MRPLFRPLAEAEPNRYSLDLAGYVRAGRP
jgi:hypothetical protein